MKIYETKSSAASAGSHSAEFVNPAFVAEFGDDIYILHQLHTKDKLAPVFGKKFGAMGNLSSMMILHNSINTPRDLWNTSADRTGGQSIYHGWDANHAVTSNRQFQMCGGTATKVWQSIYNPSKLYYVGNYKYNNTHYYVYEYDKNSKTVTKVSAASGAYFTQATIFIHEDENYLYGIDTGGSYRHSGYCRQLRIHKGTFSYTTYGFHNRYGWARPLYVDSERILWYQDIGHWSANYPFRMIGMTKWSDTVSNTTSYNIRRNNSSHINNPWIDNQKADGGKANSMLYHGYVLTDGHTVSHINNHFWSQPAIVGSGTHGTNLRSTHKVVRIYTLGLNFDDEFFIVRTNIPLPDHANAFEDTSDGRPGGLAYGSAETPSCDVRLCTLSANAGLPNPITPTNGYGASGKIFRGNASHIASAINLSFFEDDTGEGFLIVDWANPNTQNVDTNVSRQQCIFVYKITNYSASIKADLHETDSLNLALIQKIDLGYNSFGLYRPTDDAKTFIAMDWHGTSHQVYTWNSTSETFVTGSEIKGEILGIGNDSSGTIYSIHNGGGNYRYEIHTETPTLPNQITVTPASERYDFTGTTINSTVSIEAFNYAGTRIEVTVNLQIMGDGVVFTNGLATDGGKTLAVTTSASSAITENIDITSATFVRINASMSV